MKACIFDLDGTLTDTLTAISHFGNMALEFFGFLTYPKERYKKFVGDGRKKLIERILDAQGKLTNENYNKVCAVYDENYEKSPMYKTDAYEGVREVLGELKKSGIKMAVCSNKPHNVVCDVVKLVFGDDVFDCVYGVSEGAAVKPDPGCVEDILNELGVENRECIFIGDTNVDIFTAKNAGLKSIGVLWGFRDFEELNTAGADYIVEKPSEILKIVKK